MRRSRLMLAPIVAGAALLAASLASTGGAQAPAGRTLTFTERENTGFFRVIDNPPKNRDRGDRTKLTVGDVIILGGPFFNAANTARVGRSGAVCTVVTPGGFGRFTASCNGSFVLADGAIELQGLIRFTPNLRLAVVGGTGAYNGARGTFTSVSGGATSTATFTLLP
jgi:hypothetical protein